MLMPGGTLLTGTKSKNTLAWLENKLAQNINGAGRYQHDCQQGD
jgi:hypothetical protein